jgi:hypothetical protein
MVQDPVINFIKEKKYAILANIYYMTVIKAYNNKLQNSSEI